MEKMYNIFGSMFFIAQQWQNIADKIIIPKIGITTKQWMLLAILGKVFTNHLPTISETAHAYGTSRQNLKRIALELQKKGFVIIANDPNDNRIQRIALTGKHKSYFEGEHLKWQQDFITSLFKGFTENELIQLDKSTQKMLQIIKNIIQ